MSTEGRNFSVLSSALSLAPRGVPSTLALGLTTWDLHSTVVPAWLFDFEQMFWFNLWTLVSLENEGINKMISEVPYKSKFLLFYEK